MLTLRIAISLALLSVATLHAEEPPVLSRDAVHHDLFSSVRQTNDLASPSFLMQETPSKRKSPALAAIFSLLVPGMGEYYAGNFGAAKYLVIAEGALWLTYVTFDVYGTSLRDDARTFAVIHAGVNPAGKDDKFYVDVGNFMNTEEFNEKRRRERTPERTYDPNAGFGWQWNSEAARAEFKDRRLSAETVLNNRKFVLAAVVLNHLVSAINAARLVVSHNNSLLESLGEIDLRADVMGGLADPHGIRLTVSRTF